MDSPELVFLHIPKTAGTSQWAILNQYHGQENIFWIGRDCDPAVRRYPRRRIAGRPIVGGHKRLAFYPRDKDPLYCAVVRDPVERAISLFAYYARPELARSAQAREIREGQLALWKRRGLDPDSMGNSIRNCRPFRLEISNAQCLYLSRGRATFDNVRRSLGACDFVVGSLAAYGRFHAHLADLLGWPEEQPIEANRSRDNYAGTFLEDADLVATIRELNREDEKLVQWVNAGQQGLWIGIADASQRCRRLRALPVRPGLQVRNWQWEDAPGLWPPRERDELPWPLNRVLVAEPARLVYLPSPGPADAGIKRMMLELAPVAHKDALRHLGIDRVVGEYVTGLVLGDFSPAKVKEIAAAEDYYRFAIVYEPVARLVEIYRSRFVALREQLPRWPRLYELLAAAQGRAEPDCALGISFRQFVTTLASGRYTHPLWQHQSRCLPWPDTCDRLYRPDQLALLERDLALHCGLSVHIERPRDAAGVCPPFQGPAPVSAAHADTPAGELPADAALWLGELVDAELYQLIKAYYPRDFKLYNRCADNPLEEAPA